MAGAKSFTDFQWTNASLKKGGAELRSAMAKVKIPFSIHPTKKSLNEAQKQIKGYFANTYVPINIIVSKSSLSSAKKQLQTALSAVSLPQITVNPRTARALRSISNTIGNLTNASNNAVNAASNRRRGGGGGGRGGNFGNAGGAGGKGFGSGLALGQLSGEASEFSKSMEAATARVFAFGATAIVLNSVTQSFQALIASTIEVEERLIEIQSIAGTSDKDFAKFRDTIFDVAANTGQTFSTVADGAAELARQGLSASQITERLNAALILTRFSGLAAEDSVAGLTAVINGFSSANLDATEIVNKVIAVDRAFAVSTKDLVDGFTRAGSTAEDAGLSFDQLLGLITSLQQKTSRGGAVIGNGLKTIFTRISRGNVIEDLKELGVEINASQNAIEKLQAIGVAFENASGDTVKQSKIKELAAGGYQINLISAGLKDLTSQQSIYESATKTSEKAQNEAFKANEERNKSLKSQINELIVSATNLGEKLGQITFAPLLGKGLSEITDLSKAISSQLNEEAGNNIAKSLFSGIGTFIQGPGVVLLASLFARVFGLVAEYAKQGVAELNVLNVGAAKQAQIQERVSSLLQQQSSLYQRIAASSIGRQNSASRVQVLLKNELDAAQQRLKIEEEITRELQKRGAYMTASGQIGFDATAGARAKRKIGDFAKSPGVSVASSLVLGAASSKITSDVNEKTQIEITGINRQIELLEKELEGLSKETDGVRISELNKQIAILNDKILSIGDGTEKFTNNLNLAFGGLAISSLAASYGLKYGLAGAALTAALALRQFVAEPFFQNIDKYLEDNAIDIDWEKLLTGNFASALSARNQDPNVSSFTQQIPILIRESDRLTKSLDFLNQEVLISAGTFKSELNVRKESRKITDEGQFGGISSNLALNKSLNDLLKSSSSDENKKIARENERNLKIQETTFELSKIIEEFASTVQDSANSRVQELGFSSTTEVGSSLVDQFGGSLDKLVLKLSETKFGSGTLFDKLSTETLTQDRSTEAGIKAFAEGALKDLGNFSNLIPELQGLKDVLKQAGAAEELTKLQGASDALRSALDNSDLLQGTNPQIVEEGVQRILDQFKKIQESGLIPEEELSKFKDSFFNATQNFAEVQRDIILESAESEFKKLDEQKKINNDFINKLKSVYEESVTNVRDLRGKDIGASIGSSSLRDPYSKGLQEAINQLGGSGFDLSGVVSASNLKEFAEGVFNITSRKTDASGNVVGGLSQTIQSTSTDGLNKLLNKDKINLLNEQLKNYDLKNEFNQLGSLSSSERTNALGLLSPSLQRSVGKPLLDAQTAFKSGNFLEGIRLQDLAKINLQDSGVDMNSKEGELIKRMLISSGAQAKISNEFIKTQIPQDLITTSEGLNTDFSNQELDAIESRNASLGNLIKFESEVAKIYEEKITPQTKTLAEIMPSAVTATKEFAMRVNEAAKSLQGGPSMAAIEQGAQRAGAALLEIEKKIAEGSKQTGDTIAGIGPEIKDKLNTSFKEIIDALSSAKTKIDAFNANNPSEPIGAPKQ